MAKKKVAKRVAKRVDEKSGTEVHIAAPNLKTVSFTIIGESPYVQHKFAYARHASGWNNRGKRQEACTERLPTVLQGFAVCA